MRDRLAKMERILKEQRKTAWPEEWSALSSGYRLEIERIQGEILDCLVFIVTARRELVSSITAIQILQKQSLPHETKASRYFLNLCTSEAASLLWPTPFSGIGRSVGGCCVCRRGVGVIGRLVSTLIESLIVYLLF